MASMFATVDEYIVPLYVDLAICHAFYAEELQA